MPKPPPVRYDRHWIKAEVHRRGTTLREIARTAGLDAKACSTALARRHIAGEYALARFLGIAPETLWPDRYLRPTTWAKTSLKKWLATSQNDSRNVDMGAAA